MGVALTSFISIPVKEIYQTLQAEAIQWAQRSVRWINQSSPYLQNIWVESSVLVGINMVCFEVAAFISHLVHKILNYYQSIDALSDHDHKIRSVELGVVFTATFGVANWTFCKVLQLPVSIGQWAVITLPTIVIYLFWKTRVS